MYVVRSWNVFHGSTVPPSRRGHLRAMIELATRDAPGVLCLQELPVWALPELERWAGMQASTMVARPSRGPVRLAGWVQGLFRSRLAGQANAILVARGLEVAGLGGVQVSEPGRERRVAHAVRITGLGVVATTHLSNSSDHGVQRAELATVGAFVTTLAQPGETCVIAGDLNLRDPVLAGFDGGGPGVDHVLVAGAPAGPLVVWERERRVQNALVLSDHAPVERLVG